MLLAYVLLLVLTVAPVSAQRVVRNPWQERRQPRMERFVGVPPALFLNRRAYVGSLSWGVALPGGIGLSLPDVGSPSRSILGGGAVLVLGMPPRGFGGPMERPLDRPSDEPKQAAPSEIAVPVFPRDRISKNDQEVCEALVQDYVVTSSSVLSARVVVDDMRESLAGDGLALRHDVGLRLAMATARLSEAKAVIESGHCKGGTEILGIAKEHVARLLGELGQ